MLFVESGRQAGRFGSLHVRFRIRYLLGLGVLAAGASLAQPVAGPGSAAAPAVAAAANGAADLSVMTYNVKGLPWPAAQDPPLILAGDFNRGQRPVRIASLSAAFRDLSGSTRLREALRARMAEDISGLARSADAMWIRRRARDMQFLFDSAGMRLDPVAAEIPFGTEADGSSLSDHMGFTIHYRLEPRGKPRESPELLRDSAA